MDWLSDLASRLETLQRQAPDSEPQFQLGHAKMPIARDYIERAVLNLIRIWRVGAVKPSIGNANSAAAVAAGLHRIGLELQALAHEIKNVSHPGGRDEGTTILNNRRLLLEGRIQAALDAQRKTYDKHAYFAGFLYQGLDIANVFGMRDTERRFATYGIAQYLQRGQKLLDIGGNCGFTAIYAAYRYGCIADNVDHNPHMIEVGNAVAEYLDIQQAVRQFAVPFQEWIPDCRYDVVLSFAAHWTDDEGLRPDFRAHFERVHGLLEEGGLLVLESHVKEARDPAYHAKVEALSDLYEIVEHRSLKIALRELHYLRKRPMRALQD